MRASPWDRHYAGVNLRRQTVSLDTRRRRPQSHGAVSAAQSREPMTEEQTLPRPAAPPAGAGAGYGLIPASLFYVALLALLSAIGQFATSIYLPSFSAIAADLATTMPMVQLTLTVYLIVFAAAQLVYGPISDRWGRKRIVLTGTTIFLLGSVVCAAAPSIETMMAGRILQAAGASSGVVVARAVIRDVFAGAQLMRVMAVVAMIFALVPGFTPLIGGILQAVFDWRAQFVTAGLLAVALFAATVLRLPETNRQPLARLRLVDTLRGYAIVLRSRAFLRYTLSNGLVFGGLFGFLAGSPSVFIDHLGVSPTEYGIYPPITVVGFILGGMVTRRLAGQVRVAAIAMSGLGIVTAGCLVMVVLPEIGGFNRYTITATMIVYVTGLGVYAPMAISQALSLFGERAGTASSVVGFAQMTGGAAGTLAVAVLHGWFPVRAFPITMAAMTVAAFAVFLAIRRTDAEA